PSVTDVLTGPCSCITNHLSLSPRSRLVVLFSSLRDGRPNQLCVLCISEQKVFVRTNVGDSSFVEEQVEICFKNIGIMSNNDCGTASQGPAQIARNLLHGLEVKARPWLV